MDELKRCPFCNGEAAYVCETKSNRVHVACLNCSSSTGWVSCKEAARVAWNDRCVNECEIEYIDHIVDTGKFDVYSCGYCGEDFAMFGMVHPYFCPKCGSKVVKMIIEPE